MTQPKPGGASASLPEIPECHVTRLDDGRLELIHESGRTATAHTERGAVLVGLALRILASHEAPAMRPVHLEWKGHAEIPFRTGNSI
ncbi:hypothetical protein [Nonomuraea sp. 10N515B]|uniref:hypothetical protein n=1 Tax=Nonomuraea sp. 10N515B TaxID=3457422 RepID=UPI003FCCA337